MALRASLSRAACAALLLAVVATGCTENPLSPSDAPPVADAAPLDTLFARAASEFAVPVSLLEAIGYAETRWEMVEGHEEFEGMAPAFGIMALRGDRLAEGARLARVAEEAVRTEPLANLRAAAALLSRYADEAAIDRADLEAWGPVVARYSGIETSAAQAAYVRSDVYGVLREGAVVETRDGAVLGRIEATAVGTELRGVPPLAEARGMSADYGPAIWRASPNYNSRSGYSPSMVIIHSCEGSYAGCWGWLTNSQAGASAHYVVNETGSEISQLVRESDRAWHISASYDCSRNSSTDCHLNGVSSNHFTIGIEHAGYASQSSWDTGLLDASADLSCDISQDYNIPRDINHFVGHGQLQPWNRTDPGANWPWTDYLNRINTSCGSGGGSPSEIIVDSNNNLNNTSLGYISVSSNWTSSSHSTDYQTGYWWAGTDAVSDGATFWFYLDAAETRTIDAWWVSGSNRSTAAPFLMYNASGSQVGSTTANMTSNGGQWNTLGTYSFQAGWNRVVLSRWAASGSVVIADAVRIR